MKGVQSVIILSSWQFATSTESTEPACDTQVGDDFKAVFNDVDAKFLACFNAIGDDKNLTDDEKQVEYCSKEEGDVCPVFFNAYDKIEFNLDCTIDGQSVKGHWALKYSKTKRDLPAYCASCTATTLTAFQVRYETAVGKKLQACDNVMNIDENLSLEDMTDKVCSEDGACSIYMNATDTFADYPDCNFGDETVEKTYERMNEIFSKVMKDFCSSGQKPSPPLSAILAGLLSLAYLAM